MLYLDPVPVDASDRRFLWLMSIPGLGVVVRDQPKFLQTWPSGQMSILRGLELLPLVLAFALRHIQAQRLKSEASNIL